MESASSVPCRTVLVVDDQPDVRETLCDLLIIAGYCPVPAADGLEALEQIARERPALITLDLKMPRMSGWELLEVLRADLQLAVIPVIIVAGRSAEEAGIAPSEVAGYFVKPLDFDPFLATVRRVTGSRLG